MDNNIIFVAKVKSVTHNMKTKKVQITIETDEKALVEATALAALADSDAGKLTFDVTPQQTRFNIN